ncbi:3-hydroxyisobutyrate dehydrogenase [Sphingomonas psychrotolerans]|uniref:3-hydroxyisobutyrate dehydrogenase n=1 Tax=Sphingomonas psychrotolerans TaxID=1327635 RepID=A0ABU3N2F2_9SPHN|nr:3-hydroxyisobutyrate dehydrogenase [Sphingomonas psychrotolerans]MDT8758725.1 3-hydroxyisobutyrate dehydrogenase [Sphingomonas psychrotolerans]
MARIAFIGLGNMGGGMAANLAKAGHDVRAYDLSPEALDRAKQAGCLPAESANAAIGGAEAIITMLPAGLHVEAVYTDNILRHADAGAILIDCSTIDVTTARRVAEAAAAHGLTAVDAPVSGGIAAANAGSLTFMVGGSEAAFSRAEPFLSDMGRAVIHAGSSGAGQAAKICNNMMLGATMIATCESFALAEKLGLDLQKLYDIASVSSGQSWSITSYCPVPGVGPETPADRDYQGGFAAALMLKDLKLALEAAASVDADTPMAARAGELYEQFANGEGATLDFSGIIKMLRR